MTKEEKRLLLKDLCARLPYDVIVQETFQNAQRDTSVWDCGPYYIKGHPEKVKPYLRPMSSMTEEDVQEIRKRINNISIGRTITKENFEKCCDFLWFTRMSSFECVSEKMMDVVIGYLDENMFDHRGLIPMGLALEAPEDMYK